MAEELEVSLRTLYRDIADLITDGVPIRGEAGVGYVLGEGYDLPPLMFKSDELEAIMLGLSWVQRRGDLPCSAPHSMWLQKLARCCRSSCDRSFMMHHFLRPQNLD